MESENKNEPLDERREQHKNNGDNGVLIALMTAAGMLLGYILGKLFLDMPVLRFVAALVMGGVVGGAFSKFLRK